MVQRRRSHANKAPSAAENRPRSKTVSKDLQIRPFLPQRHQRMRGYAWFPLAADRLQPFRTWGLRQGATACRLPGGAISSTDMTTANWNASRNVLPPGHKQ